MYVGEVNKLYFFVTRNGLFDKALMLTKETYRNKKQKHISRRDKKLVYIFLIATHVWQG